MHMSAERSRASDTSDAKRTSRRSTPGVSRRTLVKGTAWALPAVVVASAAPAAATSGCYATAYLSLNSCVKVTGNTYAYNVGLCFVGCPGDTQVYVYSLKANATEIGPFVVQLSGPDRRGCLQLQFNVQREPFTFDVAYTTNTSSQPLAQLQPPVRPCPGP